MNTTDLTLEYYNKKADSLVDGTRDVDFSALQNEFASYIKKGGLILDLGCGSGRDSKAFIEMGYEVVAVDGSQEICKRASEYIGQSVICSTFQEFNPAGKFDGIWACASILHLPKAELEEVMLRISTALKAGGVLYSSFKYGTFEGIRNGRYFTDFTEETLKEFMAGIPSLQAFDVWVTGDVRTGREEERWINMLARRS